MSLLELKNIGKIYVSDNNVSVGIRGVNLSFDKGEFVAVTGKSGSGKSTLLNVISGMDSYEEGELLVSGEPTSHYLQPEWEEYRKQYISFIFQDYNIIESFTVLQNVELALMNIENPKERRQRALELLHRVGLDNHIHHKGSKLSGGQKQRTVIARALAKDSPIILADEPTGNLDSQSSKEIIELLREVSRDKLLIVVTHNFDDLRDYATRHIRIFDGSVEYDHILTENKNISEEIPPEKEEDRKKAPKRVKNYTLRNGLALGKIRFFAMPKLSVFLCLIMTVAMLAITLMSAMSSDALGLSDEDYVFEHIDGRVVISRIDGAVITGNELSALAEKVGASDYMHYDFMIDQSVYVWLEDGYNFYYNDFSFGYPATSVELDEGRYPERDDEVVLYVPIAAKTVLGNDFVEKEFDDIFYMTTFKVTGVKYYYDNTEKPKILFTENGYKLASAISFFSNNLYNFNYEFEMSEKMYAISGDATLVDFDLEAGSYYIYSVNSDTLIGNPSKLSGTFRNHFNTGGIFEDWGYDMETGVSQNVSVWDLGKYKELSGVTETTQRKINEFMSNIGWNEVMVISPDIIYEFALQEYYQKQYTQASLFFDSDRVAGKKTDELRELGYTAVASYETADKELLEVVLLTIMLVFEIGGWIMSVVFATLFLWLCSRRAMNATKGDIAIMRSMGIPTGVVKVGIYVQTMIALIPAFIITALVCVFIYTTPFTSMIFTFMHAPEYIAIAVALVIIAFCLSRKHIKRMFSESVKTTLRGGKDA